MHTEFEELIKEKECKISHKEVLLGKDFVSPSHLKDNCWIKYSWLTVSVLIFNI